MRRKFQPGYAIVRVDDSDTEVDLDVRITVKEVVGSLAEAKEEVARLARVNAGKRCRYFWQYTRVIKGSPEPVDPDQRP